MASILKVRDADGTVHEIHSLQGKTAYQYAQEGGYIGSEEDFNAKMAQGNIPIPTSAEVGQTIVVKAVDASGKPTAWEAANMPSGGGGGSCIGPYKFIQTVTIPDGENVSIVDITIPAKTRKLYVVGQTNTGSPFGTTVRTQVKNGNTVLAALNLDLTMSHRNALFSAELYDDIQFMSFSSSNATFNADYPGYVKFNDYASYFAKENNFFGIMIMSEKSKNQYFASGCTFDLYAACEE